MKEKCAKLWQKLSAALKPQVSADTFKRWFSAVELVEATENSLTFQVPNNIYQFWIESNHMAALQAAITNALGGPRKVKFSSPSGSSPDADADDIAVAKEPRPDSRRDAQAPGSPRGLNPRNTFDSLAIRPHNAMGHAA